jgi:hypothetical protein
MGGEGWRGGDGMGVFEGSCEICEGRREMVPFTRAVSHGRLASRLWWSLDWHLSGSEAEVGLIGIFV